MSQRKKSPEVFEQYEHIASWFDENRTKDLMEKEYLDLILNHIPARAHILDLGCGTGEPIAQFFIEKGCCITGVDGSQKMIDFCQKRFPHEHWIVGDMRTIALPETFDAILAWHSFFHLTADDQKNMFPLFEKYSKPRGILAFTSGPDAGEVISNNRGQDLYHASLAPNEYRELLKKHHFEVLLHKSEDPDCGGATVWVAQAV